MGGGRGPKAKGDTYEREVAAHINATVFGGRDQVSRAIMSGAMGKGKGAGMGGADLNGLPLLFAECKRTEALRPQWSLDQAFTNARLRKTNDLPIVISRKSRQLTGESVIIMQLDDFIVIYKNALLHLGHLHGEGGD